MKFVVLILSLVLCLEASQKLGLSSDVKEIFENYCTDCHGVNKSKGDVRLDNFDSLEKDFQSQLLNKIEEQLFIKAMPPKNEDQLLLKEISVVSKWLEKQYELLNESSKF